MNEKRKPSLHDLSLYYDGLLDEDQRKDIETQIQSGDEERRVLNVFECFDGALDVDLSDDRIDALLSDNLTCIHERLIREEGHQRKESVSLWDWLLMPRNLLAGLTAVLVLFGVFSMVGPMDKPETMIAGVFTTPTPHSGNANISSDANPDDVVIDKGDAPVVDEAQKQVILAAADLAKRAFSSGVDYAKEQTRPLGESIKAMPQTSNLSMAYQALTSSSQASASDALSPNEKLARTGTKQLAIGLGASLLSLISII